MPPRKVLNLFKCVLKFETENCSRHIPSPPMLFFFSYATDWSERWPQDHHKVEWCEGEAHNDRTGAEVGKGGKAQKGHTPNMLVDLNYSHFH